jgi:hypothetical protein
MPWVPFPNPPNAPADIKAGPQISTSSARILVAELEATTWADLERSGAVLPRRLILLEAAGWTEVHSLMMPHGKAPASAAVRVNVPMSEPP